MKLPRMTFGKWAIVFIVVHFIGVATWFAYYSKHYACFDYKASNYSTIDCVALPMAGLWEFGLFEQLIERVLP